MHTEEIPMHIKIVQLILRENNMAVTFRDFFIGLSESAPAVAQLVHDYTIWNYQTNMAERQFGLEKSKTESINRYYEGRLGIEQGQEARDKELFERTLDFKIRADEAAAKVAENAQKISDAKLGAMENSPGGLLGYSEAQLDIEHQKDQAEINKLLADINQSRAAETNYETNTRWTEIEGQTRQADALGKLLHLFRTAAKDPQKAEAIIQPLLEQNTDKNGNTDYSKLSKALHEKIELQPEYMTTAFSDVINIYSGLFSEFVGLREQKISELRTQLESPDKKISKNACDTINIEYKDRLNAEIREPALTLYSDMMDARPEYQKILWLMNGIHESLKGALRTTGTDKKIPGYGKETEKPYEIIGDTSGAPEPEVLGKSPNPYMSDESYAEAQKKKEERRKRIKKENIESRSRVNLYGGD